MITEEKISDLHELVRLFQERDKHSAMYVDRFDSVWRTDKRYYTELQEAEAEIIMLHDIEKYGEYQKIAADCQRRIDELLTKHDLKL